MTDADQTKSFRMFVRFTGNPNTYRREFEEFMNQTWVEEFIMVHHTGDEEEPHDHLHFMIIAKRGYDTITNNLKKIQEMKKLKKQYRTQQMGDAPEDYANVGSYLFNTKNGNVSTIVMTKGINEHQIKLWQSQAQEITKAFNDRELSRKREQKLNAKTCKKILSQIIEEGRPTSEDEMRRFTMGGAEQRIIEKIVKAYNDNLMKAPSRSSMTSMVLTVLSRWGYTHDVVKYYMKDFRSNEYNQW